MISGQWTEPITAGAVVADRDYRLAKAKIEEYLDVICAMLEASERGRDNPAGESWAINEIARLTSRLNRLQHIIEEIAKEIDPREDTNRFKFEPMMSRLSLRRLRDVAERLLGIIEHIPVRDEILGKQGPTLAAEGLHPWVWHAALDLWADGHYKNAVEEAAKKIELLTQKKTGRVNDNKDLYAQVFSVKNQDRRLRFKKIQPGTKSWTSAHEGAMHFGMGCAQGIRNWVVHRSDPLSEQEGLEYLAALSVLARWVDNAIPTGPLP